VSLVILADENIPAVEDYVGESGRVRHFSGRDLSPQQLTGVDALLVRSVTRVDEALLAGSPVGFVGTATSGVDHIDRDYLQRRGTGFAYAPGSNANSVVEYVLAAVAAIGDRLERLLAGGCVGIVGYGVIGKALAARLGALAIRYRVYDPWLEQSGIPGRAELQDILGCDVVTLHPELTRARPWPSYHLLDKSALRRLDRDCLLINASRGAVVDNRALLAVLARGGPLDVVLDVWEGEPAINQAVLDRVNLGTPHIAGYSLDGKLLATQMLCAAMARHYGLVLAPARGTREAPPLALEASREGADLLRFLLSSRYDITRDDRALRAATGDRGAAAAAAFDDLRRHYPERRELAGSRVRAQGISAAAVDLIHGLGCSVVALEGK
jgi:erythronate-4-phosphate dehydrogenase